MEKGDLHFERSLRTQWQVRPLPFLLPTLEFPSQWSAGPA